jgi:hypothetical protein
MFSCMVGKNKQSRVTPFTNDFAPSSQNGLPPLNPGLARVLEASHIRIDIHVSRIVLPLISPAAICQRLSGASESPKQDASLREKLSGTTRLYKSRGEKRQVSRMAGADCTSKAEACTSGELLGTGEKTALFRCSSSYLQFHSRVPHSVSPAPHDLC